MACSTSSSTHALEGTDLAQLRHCHGDPDDSLVLLIAHLRSRAMRAESLKHALQECCRWKPWRSWGALS